MSLWNAFYGTRLRHWSAIFISLFVTLTLACLDLTVGRINYPIAYILPIVAIAPLRNRRLMYVAAIALCILAYALYLIGPHVRPLDRFPAAFDFRMVNRTFAVAAILATIIVLDKREKPTSRKGASFAAGSGQTIDISAPSAISTEPAVVVLIGVSTCIAVADCLAPARFLFPILYLVMIAVCAYSRQRLFLWSFVLAVMVLTRLGYWLGPSPPPSNLARFFLLNRLFFRCCAIAIALLTAPWFEWQAMDQMPLDEDSERLVTGSYLAPQPTVTPGGPPKRILYLDHTAAIGGGEIALYNLLQHVDRDRYEPVVAIFADGPLVAMLKNAAIETHVLALQDSVINTRKETLHGWRLLLRIGDISRTFQHAVGLARFMHAGRFDLVHTNSLKSDVIGGLAGRLCGQTVLWHIRDRIHHDYLPRPAVLAFRAACCFLADFVVTNSRATLELLRPTYGEVLGSRAAHERMRVVHDGVAPAAFVESQGRDPHFVIVGLVGRISPFKGQDFFIRAAAIVLKKFPQCRFRIIGAALFNEVEYERDLHRIVQELGLEETVEFTGFRSDVATAIAELDILVHASVTGEPFGQVIVEGMAAGKPVVATSGGGVPEIVEDGATGLLVPMRNAEALADAICRLVSDPAAATAMGLRGRERVQRHFRIENTAYKIDRFYQFIFSRVDRSANAKPQRTSRSSVITVLNGIIWTAIATELAYSFYECIRAFHS